jgi:hypothetical protein
MFRLGASLVHTPYRFVTRGETDPRTRKVVGVFLFRDLNSRQIRNWTGSCIRPLAERRVSA